MLGEKLHTVKVPVLSDGHSYGSTGPRFHGLKHKHTGRNAAFVVSALLALIAIVTLARQRDVDYLETKDEVQKFALH